MWCARVRVRVRVTNVFTLLIRGNVFIIIILCCRFKYIALCLVWQLLNFLLVSVCINYMYECAAVTPYFTTILGVW